MYDDVAYECPSDVLFLFIFSFPFVFLSLVLNRKGSSEYVSECRRM